MSNETPKGPLGSAKVSRRRLVQTAGTAAGLTIAWSMVPNARAQSATPAASPVASPAASPVATKAPAAAAAARPTPPTNLDAYLRVNEDGTVTLFTGKVEFGQGIETGFRQLAAEELNLPFEAVTAVMGIPGKSPYDIATVGSLSTRTTGPRIRQAGAAMRAWLIELGAAELGVDQSALDLKDGSVIVTADPTKAVKFADLVKGKTDTRELDPNIKLKDPSKFTVIGQPFARPDVKLKVNGTAKYGIDASVKGMVWGKIVRPPAFGATLKSIDWSEAEKTPGWVGSFVDMSTSFAGFACERREQAETALAAVKAVWNPSPSTVTSETIYDYLQKTADKGTLEGEDLNGPAIDADVVSDIKNPLKIQFTSPFVNHTPIEPRSSLVEVTDDVVNVWSSTQDPWTVRSTVAQITGRDLDKVNVTPLDSGGAFGSKIQPMADTEAATLAVNLGRPVKMVWRRDEEIGNGQYRPAQVINIVTGLDESGKIQGWQYDLYSASYFPEGSDTQNGSAADWNSDIRDLYDVKNSRTIWFQSQSPLPPYYWRVNGATGNTFAREVTLDVLAEQAGQDPVTFRKAHMDPASRPAKLLDVLMAQSGWKPGVGQTGQGIGMSLVYEANSYVGGIATVDVDTSTGVIKVKHFDIVYDAGLIVNPNGITHQVEGSVTLGISAALNEHITFKNGAVTNPSFAQYHPITMDQSPTITVGFSENKNDPMGGVGEPAVAPTVAAIANAVYDKVGIRLTDVPFTPEKVLAALKAKNGGTPEATPAS